VTGAAERGKVGLDRAHLRAHDELAVGKDARNRVIDRASQPAPLRRNVNERNRRKIGAGVLIHRAIESEPLGTGRSRGDLPRPQLRGGLRRRFVLQAPDGNCKAGDALFAGHSGRRSAPDRADEGLQFGAKRLRIGDREMPHRIAPVRLEAEAFRDLMRQQVGHDVFVPGRDGHIARLERGDPVGVDVSEHAGSGAELQQSNVLSFDIRGGNGPTRVMAIDRMSSSRIASFMAATAGLNRST